MKCVHTIINHAVTNPFIELINRYFQPDEHNFYVIRGLKQSKSTTVKGKNIYVISNLQNIHFGIKLWWDILISDKIFIHGLFTPYLVIMLYLHPWILKKCNWVIWGGDLHFHNTQKITITLKIIEYLRANIIKKMGGVITAVTGDFKLAKKWYYIRGKRGIAYYPLGFKTDLIDPLVNNCDRNEKPENNILKIVVGNSADETNNHIEIINLLEKYKNENILLYALLSYGDENYSKKVIDYGKKKFGDNFIGITNYMHFKDFVIFLHEMDIVIFNHKRQQGLGILFLALYLEKKIYINGRNPLWYFFKDDLKLNVENIININNESFTEFSIVEKTTTNNNKQIVRTLHQEENIANQWKELFFR